jgi:cell cycle checkpoint protein
MKKALNAVLDREFEGDQTSRPSQKALELVMQASDGDIRSALNTLQFLTGQSAEERAALESKASKKGKKRKSNGKVKDEDADQIANKALYGSRKVVMRR